MNGKERIDYLLTKVPEDKKEAFVEDFKGVASLEDGLSVLKKYGVALTEEEMQQLTSKREMTDEELDAAAGGADSSCILCGSVQCDNYEEDDLRCPSVG